ncbi:hypothetical protein HD554DRAFT_765416 [Boletus coccyginus]|nr:hypothetical protein HD554DRAFT_765416 [Boletus coccyginus]
MAAGCAAAESLRKRALGVDLVFLIDLLKLASLISPPHQLRTVCPWKGTPSYYSADVDGKSIKDIAWYYAKPKAKVARIKDHVAFYKNKVSHRRLINAALIPHCHRLSPR